MKDETPSPAMRKLMDSPTLTLVDDPTPSEPDPSERRFLPGTQFGKRYRIAELLGRGGMGEVYRADDLQLGQSVALKFLPQDLGEDPTALARLRNEVRVARQIAHPNVCRVYDIGEAEGLVFIAMEYVDGEDLASVLRRMGRPTEEKALDMARQLCAGLAAATIEARDASASAIPVEVHTWGIRGDFRCQEVPPKEAQ